jgi:hypothetical protein
VKKANHVENRDGAWLAAAARAENVEGKLPLPHQRPMVSTGRGVRKLGIMHAAHCIACKEKMQVLMRVTGVQAIAGRRVWVQSTGCDGGGGEGGLTCCATAAEGVTARRRRPSRSQTQPASHCNANEKGGLERERESWNIQ